MEREREFGSCETPAQPSPRGMVVRFRTIQGQEKEELFEDLVIITEGALQHDEIPRNVTRREERLLGGVQLCFELLIKYPISNPS